MTQETVLKSLLGLLDQLGIAYMLTGSYASNVYGRLRSTFDADIVIALQSAQMKELSRALSPEYYVDAADLDEAVKAHGQFNAIHSSSGLKIDFYLARNTRDREALARRRSVPLWDSSVSVISPEDLILSKLLWAKEGGSARQIEDARGVYHMQKGDLDMEYLRLKAQEMAVRGELETLSAERS